jgi:hypothetical protein
MTVFDTLRAAAHALSDRTHRAHTPALAGLLQNRADDMEGNIAIWQRTGQDIPALVEKHYGVYLAVATAVLFDPRYLNSAAPSPQANRHNPRTGRWRCCAAGSRRNSLPL